MEELQGLFKTYPTLWQAVKLAVIAAFTIILLVFVLRIEKRVTRKLLEKKNNINLRFVNSIVRFALILLAVQWVVMSSPLTQPFGRILFQGTAIIGAIAGFAAQPVIADLICGLMISATKPFDIGDRIELDDGTSGVVKDITLRHVVVQTIDTVQAVIPNSRLNGMIITNMSYHTAIRSVHMRFNVAYPTDVERAKAVIQSAVRESAYTLPRAGEEGGAYSPVYFIAYADSSLVMATTVYYSPGHPTETVKDDINTRVKRALDESGIEIPYNYVNVVMSDPARDEAKGAMGIRN
ncbi:MAG: mechanosensitive ion channel family protein [Clostridia bacterium]|nr:mechanosensitive ion channel family protein [Clostridia bacterium]